MLNLPHVSFKVMEANFSPRPNHFKRQNNPTKRPTTEESIGRRAAQAVSARERKSQWEKRGRKCLTLQSKWLFQLCFWDGNATILGQPSSSLPWWFSADKWGTALHCHTGREEEKHNPDSRKAAVWKMAYYQFTLHDGRFNEKWDTALTEQM